MNPDKLSEAIRLIDNNNDNILHAAKQVDVNYFSLYNHIKGISKSFTKGRPSLLPYDVEIELVNVASYLAGRNLGLNLKRFKILAMEIYNKMHPNIENERKPTFSEQWWKSFKTRHPEFSGIRSKKTDIVKLDMYARKDIIKKFYTNYCKLYHMYLFEGDRIWNADETGSKQQEDHSFVLSNIQPNIGSIQAKNKHHVTILPCINGNGIFAPPLFIFQGASYNAEDLKLFNHGDSWATCTSSGFINEIIFLDWLKRFISWLDTKRSKSDIHLLIIDNLKAHLTYDILMTAKQNNIELLALPSNCTHIIQPLDINLFKCFKGSLRNKLPERITELMVNDLSNKEFVRLVSDLWLDTFNTEKIKKSFELVGICPLNPNIVYDKMDKKIKLNTQPKIQINISASTTQQNDDTNKKDLAINTKSSSFNHEILEELIAVKKQVAILQSQLFQLKTETTITKRKNTNLKIIPSRIMTSDEAIEEAKVIKENKKKIIKNKKKEIKVNKMKITEKNVIVA